MPLNPRRSRKIDKKNLHKRERLWDKTLNQILIKMKKEPTSVDLIDSLDEKIENIKRSKKDKKSLIEIMGDR